MLTVKSSYSLPSGVLSRKCQVKGRPNVTGHPWSRFQVGASPRGCFDRAKDLKGENPRGLQLKMVKERYEQLQRENSGREVPVRAIYELEMDYAFRAISERIPESKQQRFRDAVLCYGAVPWQGLLREAMLSLDEYFIARVRYDALGTYDYVRESVIYANTFHMEDKEVEMVVALRKVKSIVDCTRFSTKYPDTAFAKAFWRQARDCNLDRPGTLRAIEYLKHFGNPSVQVNATMSPAQLWKLYTMESWSFNKVPSKGRVQRDDCVRYVLFHVLPLLLPKLPNSPSHLIVNYIGLPKTKEERKQMIERAEKAFEMGKYPYYGKAFEESCKGKENEERDVDFRIIERKTDLGWLMHTLESRTSSYARARGSRILGLGEIDWDYDREYMASELDPVEHMRRLGAWRRWELSNPESPVSTPFAEYARNCFLHNDDRIAKWERLKKIAAFEGHREELKTSVPLLVQQWRDRLAQYRLSDLWKKEIELQERLQLNVDIDQPYVEPLSDPDDEKGIADIFSTIVPQLLETHPITGNIAMKIKGDDPSTRDHL